jgi:hypothetical protein
MIGLERWQRSLFQTAVATFLIYGHPIAVFEVRNLQDERIEILFV